MQLFFSYLLTLLIVFVVPIFVYGIFVKLFQIAEPDKKLKFFLGVLMEKIGTSFGFVTLFYLGKDFFVGNWLIYGMVWFIMFAITEVGQVYRTGSSKKEALAGIISEATYFPLAAYVISVLIG